MKRIGTWIILLAMLLSMVTPVLATEFVPSIGYKDLPKLVAIGYDEEGKAIYGYVVDGEGNILHEVTIDCILLTPFSEIDISVEIPEEARQMMKKAYDFLMKNQDFFGEGSTVRDLFDISVICDPLKEALEPEGNVLTLTFDVGIGYGNEFQVYTYKNDKWNKIPVVNNGDGTISCTFENFCPVAFVTTTVPPAQTGDLLGQNLMPFVFLMVVSAAGMVALIIWNRRRTNGQNL